MAKQPSKTTSAKSNTTTTAGTTGVWLKSLAIVAVAFLFLFFVDRKNEKQGRFQELYREFQQLQQSGGSQERLRELYNELIEIQSDTSFFTRITKGYYWAVHDLAIGGMKNAQQLAEEMHLRGIDSTEAAAREAKLAMKVGIYGLLQEINKRTPPNAVILLPEGDTITANNPRWNFIYEPEWTQYFIYPRLCVAMGKEKDNPELAKRATHIVIIEGKGYDRLKYDIPVEQRPEVAILPINEPPAPAQPQ